jgi:hypothetical protein
LRGDGGTDLVAECDVLEAGMLSRRGEGVGTAADGVVDEHRDGDRPCVRRRVVCVTLQAWTTVLYVDRVAVGEPEGDAMLTQPAVLEATPAGLSPERRRCRHAASTAPSGNRSSSFMYIRARAAAYSNSE